MFKNFINYLVLFLFMFIFTGGLLKSCEYEYEMETAKHAQWKLERENDLPYTSYHE